ncbi:MAG: phosphatase PAP2 family protein [Nanoarchaeota archaeon]|nr:phosphatase PAP2 family protein [Nanoarchaeota archaeon]MBU4086961.1 phosphatase PAP2 family protein [Nanoarchaeota archaeon]
MKKRDTIQLSFAALSLLLFIILLLSPSSNFILSTDSSVNSFLSTHQISFLISLSKLTAYVFEPWMIVIFSLMFAIILFFSKLKKESYLLVILTLLAGSFIYIIKETIQKARPINALVQESSFSFPSGHSLISLVFLGFLLYLALKNIKSKQKKTILSIILIIIMLFAGASRLILNVHWASDVLSGWFLGLFILLASISLRNISCNK